MAEPDYGLAAQIKPVQPVNPLEMLTGLENFRRLQTENKIKRLELDQKQTDVQSLKNYNQSGNLMDMRGATPELRESSSRTDSNDFKLGAEQRARKAYEIMAEKDPKEKLKKWQETGDEWAKKGWVHTSEWDRMRDNPSDVVLNGVIRGGMDTAQHMEATGQTTAARQAAEAPYQGREINPEKPFIYPAVRPGGPLSNGSPVGTIQQPGATNITSGPAPKPAPVQGSSRSPIGGNDPYYQESPMHPVAPQLPTGPGIVNQGVHPIAQTANQEGLKKAEVYSQQASAAAKDQAEIGSLRSGLESGRVKTGTFTEVKMIAAGAIYGLTHDPQLTKDLTGVDQPALEVFAKDATRRGLTFARQTEGAREAVMAIQIALRANPGLLNTVEGNKKILDILEAGDKYDQEMSKGAQAYMMKQQDTTGSGHLVGFEDHFIKAHHPSTFVSKAMPYQFPSDPKTLKDGVTYEVPTGAKNKDGTPVMMNGTWDAKTNHFMPVTQ